MKICAGINYLLYSRANQGPQHPAKQAKAMSGKQVPDRMLAHAARAKGACDDFSVCRAFWSFWAQKDMIERRQEKYMTTD